MLSLTCKSAIKSVIYLASIFESGRKASIKEISEFINGSEHTVGKLLQTLVKRKIINSQKGPVGGFYLTKTQFKQPLIHIVEAIDGKTLFKDCSLGLNKCSDTHPCSMHNEYKVARDLLENLFSTKKIADLVDPIKNGLAYLKS